MDLHTDPIAPELLYKQLRNLPVFHSPDFLNFVSGIYPGYDIHHLTGSMGSVKLNDGLVIPIKSRLDHNNVADKYRGIFCINNLAEAIKLLELYVTHLEKKAEEADYSHLHQSPEHP